MADGHALLEAALAKPLDGSGQKQTLTERLQYVRRVRMKVQLWLVAPVCADRELAAAAGLRTFLAANTVALLRGADAADDVRRHSDDDAAAAATTTVARCAAVTHAVASHTAYRQAAAAAAYHTGVLIGQPRQHSGLIWERRSVAQNVADIVVQLAAHWEPTRDYLSTHNNKICHTTVAGNTGFPLWQ